MAAGLTGCPGSAQVSLLWNDIQNKDMPHGLTQGPLRGGYNGKFYDSQEVLFNDDQWRCRGWTAAFWIERLRFPCGCQILGYPIAVTSD